LGHPLSASRPAPEHRPRASILAWKSAACLPQQIPKQGLDGASRRPRGGLKTWPAARRSLATVGSQPGRRSHQENPMNARHAATTLRLTAALILATASATASAERALSPVNAQAVLTMDCSAPRVPGFVEIGRIFEVANPGEAYALRGKVQLLVTRACHRDVDRVLITRAGNAASRADVVLLAQAR
jgi:hypothetical protein